MDDKLAVTFPRKLTAEERALIARMHPTLIPELEEAEASLE